MTEELKAHAGGERQARIRFLAEDLLENLGFELVDLEFSQGEGGAVLRLFIERPADSGLETGVTLDDCAHVSRMFGALLDVEDPIPGRYHLEISSPGLNRPLRRHRDFQSRIGETVKVTLGDALDGRRRFKGRLLAYQEEPRLLTLEVDGREWQVPLDENARCNLVYDFGK